MAKKTEPDKKVPLLIEDDSWSAGKKPDPFWSEDAPVSTAKRLYDKITKGK
jgi:hypothetical protein